MKKVILPGIVAGILMAVVGLGYSMLMGKLAPAIMAEYQNTAIFRPWTDPLMQLFFAYPFVLGLALAYVWDKVKGSISSLILGYFLVAIIPGMLITYSSFHVSLLMTLNWTLGSLINVLVAAMVLKKMNG